MKKRAPIYVISKGRHDCCLTARFLIEDGVDFKIVVEPQEKDLYAKEFGVKRLLVLPFSNLGLGSIPARNWVWEHSKKIGAKQHWILDDNIRYMGRRYHGLRLRCNAGKALAAVEDFYLRYENIGMIGLNYYMFAPDRVNLPPFVVNCHVYSCMLIRNDLPYRWRGRYNEDTDLCLQIIAGGYCTVLTNAFLIQKMRTMNMKGGNSDQLYQGDGRLKMARSLERMWPHIVQVKRTCGGLLMIDWGKLKGSLKLKKGQKPRKPSEYGMVLAPTKKIQSPELQRLVKHGKAKRKTK